MFEYILYSKTYIHMTVHNLGNIKEHSKIELQNSFHSNISFLQFSHLSYVTNRLLPSHIHILDFTISK